MRFPTMWYVRQAKPQISLRIRAVSSEPLLVAWVYYDCWATDWTPFGVSKLKRRLHRLVLVYTCQNATFLEISCTGPNDLSIYNVTVSHISIFDILIAGKLFLPCLSYFHVFSSEISHYLSYIIILIFSSVISFKFYITCVSYFHVFDSDVFQVIS